MSSSNMKTVILEQDPNAVLNLIVFAPGDGANPVLKESLRLLNILTPFHPVLPVQDIPTIKSKGDEHSGQSLGRNIFFNSKTEHHRKHQLIIFHQSINFSKNISFTDTYLKPPVWSPLRPSVGPRPLPSLQAWNDVDQKKSLDIFLLKKSTLMQLNWNEIE